MSDDRLRDLERRASHGDVESQVRWILERLRSGDLPDQRIQLAGALLGLPGSSIGTLEEHFLRSLEHVVPRPAMYFGQPNIFHMGHFVTGASSSLHAASGVNLLKAWRPWIEQKYLIVAATWSWERILLYAHNSPDGAYASHAAAISALPKLFEQYFASQRELGEEGIKRLLDSRMAEVRGRSYWVPDPDPTQVEWERWWHGRSGLGSPRPPQGPE